MTGFIPQNLIGNHFCRNSTDKQKNKDKEERFKKKTPRDLGPEDFTVHTRCEGPMVQLCGDNDVACRWINGEVAQGTKYKETIGKIQRILHSWWKRRVAAPNSDFDSFVEHAYREHDQEADHWANIGAQGRRKIDIYRKDDPTTWKKRYVASGMEASKDIADSGLRNRDQSGRQKNG